MGFITPKQKPPHFTRDDDFAYRIKAKSCFVAKGADRCYKCGAMTPVFCIALPSGYEEVHDGVKYTSEDGAFIENLERVNSAIAEKLIDISKSKYRPTYSKMSGSTYWMNHCEKCDAPLGDFFLHSEPDGPFFSYADNDIVANAVAINLPLLAR